MVKKINLDLTNDMAKYKIRYRTVSFLCVLFASLLYVERTRVVRCFFSLKFQQFYLVYCENEMSSRKRISFDKKLKILEECKKGVNLSIISQKYGIAKSSICTLKKNENKIVENLKITNNGTKNRRSLKKGEFPGMEKVLFEWFLGQRNKHIPVNGMVLKAKALEIHNQMYGSNFHASDGWLSRFKKRYGIRLLKQTGEKLSARQDLVEPFKNHFHNLIREHNLTSDAIFNADETGLCWKLLPDKTFVHAGETSAPGRKLSKERVTVLLCANASGSKKVKPLLIGKAKKPRSFKNRVIPTNYTHSKNAWMNSAIFKMWFFEMFVPEVEQFLESNNLPIKALLILDNAPSHPPAEELVKTTIDGKIWTLYLPPNVTPLIQPMDQNAIRILKMHYRNHLLSKIISSKTEIVVDFLKNLNLYEAAYMIDLAWKKIKKECLANCWNKIMSSDSGNFDEEDEIPLSRLGQMEDVECLRRGVRLLSAVFPNITFNADDVSNWNEDIVEDVNIEDEENECDVIPVESEELKIKHSDAIKGFETCILWCDQNRIDVSKSLVLRELQEEAIQRGLQSTLKQSFITDFLIINNMNELINLCS